MTSKHIRKHEFFISFLLLIAFQGVKAYRENDECGRITPYVKKYIYGGKPSMIEQWPWQVFFYETNKIK